MFVYLYVSVLPDYLKNNLDIIFINPNPSLHSAWSGRYFDGPGEQFWDALFNAGVYKENIFFTEGGGVDFLLRHSTTADLWTIGRNSIFSGGTVYHAVGPAFIPSILTFKSFKVFQNFCLS